MGARINTTGEGRGVREEGERGRRRVRSRDKLKYSKCQILCYALLLSVCCFPSLFSVTPEIIYIFFQIYLILLF